MKPYLKVAVLCALTFSAPYSFAAFTQTLAPQEHGLSHNLKTVNLQTSPVSMAFRRHYNLTAMFPLNSKWLIGTHGVFRPDSYVEGFELGFRSEYVLQSIADQVWILAKTGVQYFDLTRSDAKTYHEGGMFTPYHDAHTPIGTFRGIYFELGASTLIQVVDRFNVEIGTGFEFYNKAFYLSDDSVNRVLPVVEFNVGFAI